MLGLAPQRVRGRIARLSLMSFQRRAVDLIVLADGATLPLTFTGLRHVPFWQLTRRKLYQSVARWKGH